MGKHHVLVVDDDPALRRLIRRVVERVPELEVVGEAPNGHEALQLARRRQPDIVLTDIAMPGMDGVELTERLLDAFPLTRVVALTGAEPGAALSAMIRNGAVGYLVKTASIEEMVQALHAVSRGHAVLSPEVTSLVLKDLVHHYRTEQQRAEALAALDAMKRDFINVISHELRTPVTIIKGGVQTLKRGVDRIDPERQRSFLDSAETQCLRLQRMIDQVLIVSQIDKGSGAGHAVTDLSDVIADALSRFSAAERDRVEIDVAPEVVVGRKRELAQVTGWIIENALAFSDDRIRISSDASTSEVLLDIRDEGVGMDAELVGRVLAEPFTQRDASSTRPRDGLGLSLYAARQVLEGLGGTLQIHSQAGRGTNVVLHLNRSGVGPPAGGMSSAEPRAGDG